MGVPTYDSVDYQILTYHAPKEEGRREEWGCWEFGVECVFLWIDSNKQIILCDMKKFLLGVMVLMGTALVSSAQDVITTRSGEDIQAKVLEVSPILIRYKRFSNLDGPTYSIDTSQIVMIRYENGEKDIFESAPVNGGFNDGPVLEGLRYREMKHIYDPKMYIRQFDDKYSPGWLGVASFIIPGLGEAIEGEWWRAIGFVAGNVGLKYLIGQGVDIYYSGNINGTIDETYEISTLAKVCAIANIGLNIWSVVDAVRIAKVKNMYYQDLRARRGLAALDVKLEPFVASVPSPVSQGFTPSAGLSFKITFPNQ